MLSSRLINAVCQEIYRRFPEVRGCSPDVKAHSTQTGGSPRYSLTFRAEATTANGKRLPRWVRATVDAQGKIVKLTTSR